MEMDAGARPAALGGAFTGLADSADAIAYNPAGLAVLPRGQVTFMHDQSLPGVREEWLAIAQPSEAFGTLAASAHELAVDPFSSYDANDTPTGRVSEEDMSAGLAWAIGLGKKVSIGAGGQLVRSRLASKTAATGAVDVGVHVHAWPALELGAAALHLGNGMRYDEVTDPLPRTVRVGAALHPLYWIDEMNVDERVIDHVSLTADYVMPENSPAWSAGGLEFAYGAMFVRLGGRAGGGFAGPGYTAGVGIALSRLDKNRPELDFDYAFVSYGDLGQTHRVGITLKFGDRIRHEASWSSVRWPWSSDDEPRRRERAPDPIFFSPSSL